MITSDQARAQTFAPTRFREGYDPEDVDQYLDQIVDSLQGLEAGLSTARSGARALGPKDVLDRQFTVVKLSDGYDPDDVDDFLDRVVATLREYELRAHAPAPSARDASASWLSGGPTTAVQSAPSSAPAASVTTVDPIALAPVEPLATASVETVPTAPVEGARLAATTALFEPATPLAAAESFPAPGSAAPEGPRQPEPTPAPSGPQPPSLPVGPAGPAEKTAGERAISGVLASLQLTAALNLSHRGQQLPVTARTRDGAVYPVIRIVATDGGAVVELG